MMAQTFYDGVMTDELDSTFELLRKLNSSRLVGDEMPNMMVKEDMNLPYKNLLNKYSEVTYKYNELSRLYNESLREQKEVLEKCIRYQDEIMELQDKYSKLQEQYIKLTHYVFGNDSDNEEINKIKIA